MEIEDFLKKHQMTAYQFCKITNWKEAQISRFKNGKRKMSPIHKFTVDLLDWALDHGYPIQDTSKNKK